MQLCLRGEISWSPDCGIVCWLETYWKWKLFNSQPSCVNYCVHSSDVGCYKSQIQLVTFSMKTVTRLQSFFFFKVSTGAKIKIKIKQKKVFIAIKMQTLSCRLFLNEKKNPAFVWVLRHLFQIPNAPPAYEKISSGTLPPPYSPWRATGEHRTWKNKEPTLNILVV